jgi:ferredoxin
MARLVDVLMDLDSAPRSAAPRAVPAARAPVPAAPTDAPPAEAAPAAVVEEDEDDVSFDEPWIDTPLCTTCNECTNINPALFKYNADNQAYIADPDAGTYAEMVKAAVKCPARCIHPGAPRPGDETATDELRARAAQFN